jgi:hypothetical protein
MPRYRKTELERAVRQSRSYAETLRRLGMCSTGGNWLTLKKWIAEWELSTSHFDAHAASIAGLRREARPLEEILVEGSSYNRGTLKRRLYDSQLKQRVCELCGQGESWQGKPMSLILDHANGVSDDNRIENLRIVCPNCAATLETHCGRRNRRSVEPLECARCGAEFTPKSRGQRYCSRECGQRAPRRAGPRPAERKVQRPPHAQLVVEVRQLGFLGTGRRYGVSDNAIRKWLRQYEREAAAREERAA